MKNIQFFVIMLLIFSATAYGALTNPPNANIDYAFAYLPAAGALIMHGGWGPPGWQPKSNVWQLAGVGWSELPSGSAPTMTHHCGALDTLRGVIAFCGKSSPGFSTNNMTWEYNGTLWQEKNTLHSGLKGDVEIAYDSARNKIVAYVGPDWSESGMETWEYDGSGWSRIITAHNPTAAEDGALMQYDPVSNNVVLITSSDNVFSTNYAETWVYDGTDWELKVAGYPTNAMLGGLAYDAARGKMTLLTTDSETWTWDGNDWTLLHPAHSPTPARGFFTMAYDPFRSVCVIYSGEYGSEHPIDTWEWDGSDWAEFIPIPEPGAFGAVISYLLLVLSIRRKFDFNKNQI